MNKLLILSLIVLVISITNWTQALDCSPIYNAVGLAPSFLECVGQNTGYVWGLNYLYSQLQAYPN